MTLVEKRKEDLKITKMRLKHLQAKSKTLQDIFDAVVAIDNKVQKANRDMRNLATRKSTPQWAFDTWERQYCEPSIGLVQLNEQLK